MSEPAQQGERASKLPWSRALLLIAVAGPALCLGGVKPCVIPSFCVVVFALLLRRCLRDRAALRVPAWWWLGAAAAGLTFLQWMPLPPALLDALAPGLRSTLGELLAGTRAWPWSRLSVQPGQTALECARLLALTGLFVAAAQLSWRLVATQVAVASSAVALIGLVQKLAGAEAIYGVYRPRQDFFALGQGRGTPLLTSFVNPNHQSALFLLGVFVTAALAMDLRRRASRSRGDRHERERLADRAYLAWGAVVVQATALVLSMSRAALVAALIVAPLAAWLGTRGGPRRAVAGPGEGRWARRLLPGIGVAVLLAIAASEGAWAQLSTLGDRQAFIDKFRVAYEGAGLIPMSPALGVGRGAFVDLFPLVDSQPGVVQFTHLESTPVAAMVEWGPVFGLGLIVALALWWLASMRAAEGAARRVALCGLLAVAIQAGADFCLDYLGVAAPVVAIAGTLGLARARAGAREWTPRAVLVVAGLGAIVGVAMSVTAIPKSWSARHDRDLALLAGDAPAGATSTALLDTPLDPFVHLVMARELAAAGEWSAAAERAEVAARLRPAALDARLLAAVAAAKLGRPLDAIEHLRGGLEHLREPAPPELIDFLLERFPEPGSLAAFAPEDAGAWASLAQALRERSPAHARALAQARVRTHPEDPEPLRLQAQLALAAKNPGLALHHARFLVSLRPDEALAHKLRADARYALRDPEQTRAAVAELEQARDRSRMDDLAVIDEMLVLGLLRLGDRESLERAELVLDELLARRAEPQARRRREALADRVAEALVGHDMREQPRADP
ncbi:hypothetical protein G6O69_37445 [Pseudenhygromyxa sp. WMMC2535]|uniref:hypothetical protein n=1 Tax=Pseudenhygromyxa sp. WMMC2535 TaxID=2712867 RepID=UPI001552981C|nr:hypothetical protein [Pseudenhygromyxa sp. WMMC2535]NVB37198.1 hypothetical protein [Pseudenhygromyxa sp. WMMC2535]NVB43561.1 hypothetical protein [Pseudenhygromyxa sp. WMMC2535]